MRRATVRTELSPAVFMIRHWMLGALAGALCASIVLILDIARLRTLLSGPELLGPGLVLLFGGFMLTFAAVVCATALMQLPDRPPDA